LDDEVRFRHDHSDAPASRPDETTRIVDRVNSG
jgi:hypothetical protein